MRFLYPEVLFAFAALVIPILVHLFRLRPVKKEWFTNVAFLKRLEVQTQRVSKLKKRLLLASRLLMLSAIILAFARPISADHPTKTDLAETVIFLDNSLSMQAEGDNGPLLEEAVQTLLSQFPKDKQVKIFTHDRDFPSSTLEGLQNDLIGMPYSPVGLTEKQISLKIQGLLTKNKSQVLLLSDFKSFNSKELDSLKGAKVYSVVFEPLPNVNASVDSLFLEKNANGWQLSVQFSTNGTINDVPVSVWNGKELLAKSTFSTENAMQKTEIFNLPAKDIPLGRVEIEDNGYLFDNPLFFSLQSKEKIKVLVIGDTLSSYLKRIYTPDEFTLEHITPQTFSSKLLSESDFVVLNELQSFPSGLSETLVEKVSQGGSLFIVFPIRPNAATYQSFLSALGSVQMENLMQGNYQVSEISTQHPIFAQAFEKDITNFDYPTVKSYIKLSRNRVTPLLQFANRDVFFGALSNKVFMITTSLNASNTNFQKSPLIVPAFYSTARNSLKLSDLYISIGKPTSVAVKATLNKEEVLQLPMSGSPYIPLQTLQPGSVTLTFEDAPTEAGHYPVVGGQDTLRWLAFNYVRTENKSKREASQTTENKQFKTGNNKEIFKELKALNQPDEFWKWFVIFALVFFMAETLILKLLP